jgi:hypothetical protein
MKTFYKKEKYFLQSSINFFSKNEVNRIFFLKKFNFIFEEISYYLNECINFSKKSIFFCCGNFTISKHIKAEKIYINEIIECDHIIFADIEHQNNITENLMSICDEISDDARVIVISKSLVWSLLIKLFKFFYPKYAPKSYNFLPFDNLKSYLKSCNLEIIKNEKIIFFPFNIPLLNQILNKIFRLQILNFFCLINITILKKKYSKEKINPKISYIIPCKNEENNIKKFKKYIEENQNIEFLFGDDKSDDHTKDEIKKLESNFENVKYYEGPGICKADNVFKGFDIANGEILLIYDADLTVQFSDIEKSIEILKKSNADLINCSRMIYPQQNQAMKKLNFIGNILFAKLFSIIFKKKITDTLCGTKIFFKKDWLKIKKFVSKWGIKDHWGDFDILLSAYQNNLKICEVPVHYFERETGKTKMINLFSNTSRMLAIVFCGYYKLKIKKTKN